MSRLKELVKRLVGERGRLLVRRFGRVRWLSKARQVRNPDISTWHEQPRRGAAYVALDPEVDTFSYALANEDELAEELAALLDVPGDAIRGYLREANHDPGLARHVGLHVWHHKLRPPLVAHQLSAYAAVRAVKPGVAVETGILDGLGSRTILRALARNAAEGAPGRLYSFDIMPGAGWLVPDGLRALWTPVYKPALEELERGTVPAPVGFYLHDSLPDPEYQRSELEWAARQGEPGAVMLTTHGWSGVLDEVAEASGGRSVRFKERPADHFYTGRTIGIARLARG